MCVFDVVRKQLWNRKTTLLQQYVLEIVLKAARLAKALKSSKMSIGLCSVQCTITVFLIYWTDNNHNLKSRLPILQISGPNGAWMLKKKLLLVNMKFLS